MRVCFLVTEEGIELDKKLLYEGYLLLVRLFKPPAQNTRRVLLWPGTPLFYLNSLFPFPLIYLSFI